MWKLNLPSKDDAEKNIEIAFTYKKGTKKFNLTQTELKNLLTFYESYETAKGVADVTLSSKGLRADVLNAMENAYAEVQGAGRLKDLRNRLFLNAKTCPCCGIIAPDELDHHLPISKYQAFAIYSSNLIPYCHKCNNKKRTTTGIDPNKRFIHVYYDAVPMDAQFLFCDVSIKEKGLVIALRINKIHQLSDQLYKQMVFQIEKVELTSRLTKELNIHLSASASYIQSDFENGGKSAVQNGLLRSATAQKITYGINHWRPVLMEALANHDEFCDGGFYEPLSLIRP